MNEKVWFENLKDLYRRDRLLQFWPNRFQNKEEKINSFSRFVLYAGVLISIYQKSANALIISIIILLSLFLILQRKTNTKNVNVRYYNPKGTAMIKEKCQLPTTNNPFANVLMGDPSYRNQACPIDSVHTDVKDKFNSTVVKNEFDIYDRENSQRQFYTTSNTLIPNDQSGFANWLYGNQKVCKTQPKACTGFP